MSKDNLTYEQLFDLLQNECSEEEYWSFISRLRKLPCNEVYEKAIEFIKSDNKKDKIIGIDVLQQLGFNPRFKQEQTVKLHFELLEVHKTDVVTESLLYGIGHNNENLSQLQIDNLTQLDEFVDDDINQAYISALSGINNIKAIRKLIQFTNSKNSDIRNWSTFGIGTQVEVDSEEIREALWKRVKDSNFETKSEAIYGLAKRKDYRIKSIIMSELKNESYGTLILESTVLLNDSDLRDQLKENLKTATKDETDWPKLIKEAISEIEKTHNTR